MNIKELEIRIDRVKKRTPDISNNIQRFFTCICTILYAVSKDKR